MKLILKCLKCDKYTLKESCSQCQEKTVTVQPAKYNPEDKFGKYRRKVKKEKYQEKGWL